MTQGTNPQVIDGLFGPETVRLVKIEWICKRLDEIPRLSGEIRAELMWGQWPWKRKRLNQDLINLGHEYVNLNRQLRALEAEAPTKGDKMRQRFEQEITPPAYVGEVLEFIEGVAKHTQMSTEELGDAKFLVDEYSHKLVIEWEV